MAERVRKVILGVVAGIIIGVIVGGIVGSINWIFFGGVFKWMTFFVIAGAIVGTVTGFRD
jgi:uncharacterized protein YcfJ